MRRRTSPATVLSTILVVLFSFICVFPAFIGGQTTLQLLQAGVCEPFAQVPSACQGVLNSASLSSVWTAPTYGVTQEVLGAQMMSVIRDAEGNPLTTALDLVATMPYDCGFHYLKLLCPTYFRTCVASNSSGMTLHLPLTPCRSMCNETNTHCSVYWSSHGLPPLDCERVDSITGSDLYPIDGGSQPCTVTTDDQIIGPVQWTCPPPTQFVAPEDGADMLTGLPCAMPCTKIIYLNSNQLDASYIVWIVLNWISLVAISITLIVFFAVPTLRQFPYRTIIYIGLGLFIFHLGFSGNVFWGMHDTLCDGEYTLRFNSWCKFQVFAIYGPSLFAAFWWVYQSFLLFWGVGLLQHDFSALQSLEIPLLIGSFVYALTAGLIITFVPNHQQTGGGLTGFPFCLFTPFSNDVSGNLVWGLWYAPMMVGVLCIIFFVVVTLGRVAMNSETFRKSIGIITSQILVICYAGVFIWVISSNISFKAWSIGHSKYVSASFSRYFQCVLTTFGMPSDCEMDYKTPASIFWNIIICFSLIGVSYCVFMLSRTGTRTAIGQSLAPSSSRSRDTDRSFPRSASGGFAQTGSIGSLGGYSRD